MLKIKNGLFYLIKGLAEYDKKCLADALECLQKCREKCQQNVNPTVPGTQQNKDHI